MKEILEAAREQIAEMLEGDLYAKNFSDAIRVAKLAEEIAANEGRSELVRVKHKALAESEFFAPILYEAILADLATGNDMLKDKYDRLQRAHADLERKHLMVDAAGNRLNAERKALDAERTVIHEERLAMRKVHAALAIENKSGVDLPALPPIPELPPDPLDEEEEEDNGNETGRD